MTDGKSPALSAERVSMGIEELKTRHGPPPWAAILVQTDRYVVTVICQAPGHRNDWHYHLAEARCLRTQLHYPHLGRGLSPANTSPSPHPCRR